MRFRYAQVMTSRVPEAGTAVQTASDALYRTFFEQAAYGVFVSDAEGHYLDVNERGCEMLGYSREDILSLSVKDLVHVDEQQEDRMPPREAVVGLKAFVEHNLVCKDHHLLPVEINAQILPNRNVMAIIHDASERKKTEEEIRHVSRLYATLSQVNQTIIRVKDKDTLFHAICDIAVEFGEFDLAAIGEIDEKNKTVTLSSFNGAIEDRPYTTVEITSPPYDKGLMATAINSGKVVTTDSV